MNDLNIPKDEIDIFIQYIRENANLFNHNCLIKKYKKKSRKIIDNPFSISIVTQIAKYIKKNKPMSVIRMGDGEMNLLTYSKYPHLPKLSFLTAKKSVLKRQHSFKVNTSWLFIFEETMMTAIKEADMVGVLGLWRPGQLCSEKFVTNLNKKIRGKWGQWTGLHYINLLVDENIFNNKIISSAHLYFSIIENLPLLFKFVEKVYLITNQDLIIDKLRNKFPKNQFILISEAESQRPLTSEEPSFINNIMMKVPTNMSNTLTLVGAGPWSEFYCTWIKRRGGVAIDIGSGFDLLLNKSVRPIHNKFTLKIDI